MRLLSTAPFVIVLGVALIGCNGAEGPADGPQKAVEAWVQLEVPGMT